MAESPFSMPPGLWSSGERIRKILGQFILINLDTRRSGYAKGHAGRGAGSAVKSEIVAKDGNSRQTLEVSLGGFVVGQIMIGAERQTIKFNSILVKQFLLKFEQNVNNIILETRN